MAPLSSKLIITGVLVALTGSLWQFILRDTLFVSYGVGRRMQKISEFPYKCRKVIDRQVEACEDMWLDEESRTLYLACSDVMSRIRWMPNINKLSAEHRSLNDHIVAMSIDKPTSDGSYGYTVLKPTSHNGAGGESSLYLVGLTGRHLPTSPSTIELFLINAQPSFNPDNTLSDQLSTGGNSTIELFHTSPSSSTMNQIKTFFHPKLTTPNNVAIMPDGSIFYTNDHGSSRHGWRHDLSPVLKTGDVSHCTSASPPICRRSVSGFSFPNGLHYSSRHNLLFVPSAALGDIHVYRPHTLPKTNTYSHELEFIEIIKLDYPIDNISEDANGILILAVLPKSGQIFEKFTDYRYISEPRNLEAERIMQLGEMKKQPATAAFTIRRTGAGPEGGSWEVKKLIEDSEGQILPAATTVVRDAKTGRLFISGVVSEWIAVCEPEDPDEVVTPSQRERKYKDAEMLRVEKEEVKRKMRVQEGVIVDWM